MLYLVTEYAKNGEIFGKLFFFKVFKFGQGTNLHEWATSYFSTNLRTDNVS
jgi:hypothetical protein